jgi:hypothetical protein
MRRGAQAAKKMTSFVNEKVKSESVFLSSDSGFLVMDRYEPAGLSRTASLALFLWFFASSTGAFGQTTTVKSATSGEIKAFFQSTKKTVLTFVGYSGAGYEDEASMLKQAERILSEFDPKRTIRHRVGAGEAMQRRTIAVR